MALPSSGTIKISDIVAEFGYTSSPYPLTDYYRGGSYVPDSTTNAGIPISGTIKLSDFYSSSALLLSGDIPDPFTVYGASGASIDPGSATFTFDNVGNITSQGLVFASGSLPNQVWCGPDVAANYDLYFDATGDTPTGAALNTWLNMGTSRTWTLQTNPPFTYSLYTSGSIYIRPAGGGSTLLTISTVILSATSP